jgi:hypothetical protein
MQRNTILNVAELCAALFILYPKKLVVQLSRQVVTFKTTILKFDKQGEKTGWTYIKIPSATAEQLKPGNKKAFRVRGFLDNYQFEKISLIPLGGGDFILALNATIRKALRKTTGATVLVKMETDERQPEPPPEFIECLKDEPRALTAFSALKKSHQNYFINWMNTAKTDETKAKRIAYAVDALSQGLGFGGMMRKIKQDRQDLFPG